MTMPTNTLLHTFSVYNAIVILDDDGTQLHWNNTLGFTIDRESLNVMPWPIVDISDMSDILAAAKEARDNLQKE
jgi:protein associated with RNAse G/E